MLLMHVRLLRCLSNQTSQFSSRCRLPRGMMAFWRGWMSHVSDSTAYNVSVQPMTLFSLFSSPPLSAKARRRLFRSCRGSILRTWLSYEREVVCRIITVAHKPFGMSVQPGVLILSIRRPILPAKRDGEFSPHAKSVTPAGCFVLGGWHVCSTRRADFVCSQARWQFFNSCWVCNTCI